MVLGLDMRIWAEKRQKFLTTLWFGGPHNFAEADFLAQDLSYLASKVRQIPSRSSPEEEENCRCSTSSRLLTPHQKSHWRPSMAEPA